MDKFKYTNGFGGRKILKDGIYDNFSVFWGRIYEHVNQNTESEQIYKDSLKIIMQKTFKNYTGEFEVKRLYVDNGSNKHQKIKVKESDIIDPLTHKPIESKDY